MSTKDTSGNEGNDEYGCPWDGCDYTSHSEHGIKCHHSQAHGESIAGEATECEICGDTFRYKPYCEKGRFCSNDCYGTWLSENTGGENNPNWKAKVAVECATCGTELKRHPCRIERQENHFCDITCRGEWQSEHRRGENHPNYNSVETVCGYCGESVIVKRCHYEDYEENYCGRDCANKAQVGVDHSNSKGEVRNPKYEGVPRYTEHECEWCGETALKDRYHPEVTQYFCNKSHHDAWQREHGPKGQDHWNWRNGQDIRNAVVKLSDPSFKDAKSTAREAHGEECVMCDDDVENTKIDWHHIVPVVSGGINNADLLMPLCPTHHATVEWHSRTLFDVHLAE